MTPRQMYLSYLRLLFENSNIVSKIKLRFADFNNSGSLKEHKIIYWILESFDSFNI